MVKIYLSLCLCLLCASCTNNPSLKDDDENPHSSEGELVPIEIVQSSIAAYNQQDPPATRVGIDGRTESVPILSEWVAIKKPFSAIDAPYDGPTMVAMELRQDSVTPATSNPINTRSYMDKGDSFRLITFIKKGDDYVFHSVGTYVGGGYYSPPTLVGGKALRVPLGCEFRVVGYTYDLYSAAGAFYLMGPHLNNYIYCETPIFVLSQVSVANEQYLYAYDSGNLVATGASMELAITFVSQHSMLRVKTEIIGIEGLHYDHCSGVIKDIGTSGDDMNWKVGDPNGLTGSRADLWLPEYQNDGSWVNLTCMPFLSPKKIDIDISSIQIGYMPVIENIRFSSAKAITMKPGNSYTLTLKFHKVLGTQLKPDQMTMCQPDANKVALSKLIWADGNLLGTKDGEYEWAPAYWTEDAGYFYTYMTRFKGEGNTTVDGNDDPCKQLKKDVYGVGWRTPTVEEMSMLARCTSKKYSVGGRYAFSSSMGLFLPDGGYRSATDGCGTVGTYVKQIGRFATSDKDEVTGERYVLEMNGTAAANGKIITCDPTIGVNVRCVKDGELPPP